MVFDAFADGAFNRETKWTPLTLLRPMLAAPWALDRKEPGLHCLHKASHSAVITVLVRCWVCCVEKGLKQNDSGLTMVAWRDTECGCR